MTIYPKFCAYCEKPFYGGDPRKIFCSRDCKWLNRRRPHKKYRKNICEKCGFVPEHMCQLDVDHIDGNNSNNDPNNLQTLCANCHRLKTLINEDWKEKGPD